MNAKCENRLQLHPLNVANLFVTSPFISLICPFNSSCKDKLQLLTLAPPLPEVAYERRVTRPETQQWCPTKMYTQTNRTRNIIVPVFRQNDRSRCWLCPELRAEKCVHTTEILEMLKQAASHDNLAICHILERTVFRQHWFQLGAWIPWDRPHVCMNV